MQNHNTSTVPITADTYTATIKKESPSQPEQAQMDIDSASTSNESNITGGPYNSGGLTDEDMEAVLATIEAQRRSVTLARRLAVARSEQARGFPVDERSPLVAAYRPREPAALAAQSADAVREANIRKEKAQLFVPRSPTYEELFKSYRDIRQRNGESVDSLIARINALEEKMPTQPEQPRIHTLLFALHISAQDKILKRQNYFTTRNELQKLALELDMETKQQQRRRDPGGPSKSVSGSGVNRVSGRDGQTHNRGGSHAPSRISKGKGRSPGTGVNGALSQRERRGKDRNFSNTICYNCEKPGHVASNCSEQKIRERSGKARAQ